MEKNTSICFWRFPCHERTNNLRHTQGLLIPKCIASYTKQRRKNERDRQQDNQKTQLPGDSTVFTLHVQKPRSLGESLRITRGKLLL